MAADKAEPPQTDVIGMAIKEEAKDSDPTEEFEKGYGSGPQGMREVQLFGTFHFNPVVSICGGILLWLFVLYVSLDKDQAMKDFGTAKADVSHIFTWLYVASQDYWLLFLVPLCYYYGHVKLGRDDEQPEYSDLSYFCMVFTSGVAIGLVFYGASEPLTHMLGSSNRYSGAGYLNDNQKAQDAINVTLFHWGVQAWVVYGITAISMGFLSYRKGLPLCFRTTLAPLFGKATWGWFGDFIDIITIVTIVAGLCTSLGLGAKQIVGGLVRLEWVKTSMSEDELTNASSWVIVAITLVATASVVSGINVGIKTLSQVAFVLGNFLLCTVFFLDAPWHLANVMVQTLGYHLQHIVELGFFCDAWGQLKDGEGRAVDGKGASDSWMNSWTIFYWGWWIAWAPFVGTFLARISRGRTIRNVTAYVLTVPFAYALVWFCTFGAAAIRMHRRAAFLEEVGRTSFSNADYFRYTGGDYRPAAAGKCYWVPETLPGKYAKKGAYVTDHRLSPVCQYSSKDGDGYWFDLMNQYHKMGPFLSMVTIVVISLFFVTSSDSGSLVVELIAANGKESHVIQRIFWALSEGAVAVALIQAGGSKALTALQAISICAGLPFTVIMMYMTTALWRALKIDAGHMQPRWVRTDWALPLYGGICDYIEYPLSRFRSELPQVPDVVNFFVGLFCPPLLLFKATRALAERQSAAGEKQSKSANSRPMDAFMAGLAGILYLCFCLFHILAWARVNRGFSGLAWAFLVCFASILAACRHSIRRFYRIEGSGVEDWFISLFWWPQVLAQMARQVTVDPKPVVL